jgi:hypothetical protein
VNSDGGESKTLVALVVAIALGQKTRFVNKIMVKLISENTYFQEGDDINLCVSFFFIILLELISCSILDGPGQAFRSDQRLRCGNHLVGVTRPQLISLALGPNKQPQNPEARLQLT